jgi:hypothetical protein
MPDLVIQNFQTGLSTAAITKAVPVSLTLKNQGFAVAAYGVEIRYYLSRDYILDEQDMLIASRFTASVIPIGGRSPFRIHWSHLAESGINS